MFQGLIGGPPDCATLLVTTKHILAPSVLMFTAVSDYPRRLARSPGPPQGPDRGRCSVHRAPPGPRTSTLCHHSHRASSFFFVAVIISRLISDVHACHLLSHGLWKGSSGRAGFVFFYSPLYLQCLAHYPERNRCPICRTDEWMDKDGWGRWMDRQMHGRKKEGMNPPFLPGMCGSTRHNRPIWSLRCFWYASPRKATVSFLRIPQHLHRLLLVP